MASSAASQGPSKSRRSSSGRRLLLKLVIGGGIVLAGVFSFVLIDVNWRFARLEAAAQARVFSAPYVMTEDLPVDRADLAERLTRLGYRKVNGAPLTPGEYAIRFHTFDIYLNEFDYPEGRAEARRVRVKTGFGRVGNIEDGISGENLAAARLEPEQVGALSGNVREERAPVDINDLPKDLLNAVVAVEDRRFERHLGVDPRGILRALFANVKSGEVVQGGSTITQQLAKNLYPDAGDRTITRKLWETLAAICLEMVHSKPEILERYLNQIYLAQRGPTSIIGVGAAARHYFGKDARYLDLSESALLAGFIQSPGRYQPYRHQQAALERRNLVLRLMRDEGFISTKQLETAAATPLLLRREPSADPRMAPYFVDFVAQELQRLELRDPASHVGLRVFTTLDPLLQARAQAVLERSLAAYETQYRQLRPMPGGALQGAIVALRPRDGAVVVMVGGRNYSETQFNRAVQAHRQPGSLFKPFVYLAGFEKAQRDPGTGLTAATVLDDSPLEVEVAGEPWTPHNYDEEFRGPVSARQALTQSLNIPTIRAAELVGLRDVVRMARRCGIESRLEPVPSIALGTFEVSPLEIAAAFTTIANLGERAAPRVLTAVVKENGEALEVPAPETRQAVSPQAAWLTLDLMHDVVDHGTGAGIWAYGVQGPYAGKTGTTDDGRDAWFVGFNANLLAITWVGFDNNRPLRLGGSALALPIWAQFMARSGPVRGGGWERPDGIVEVNVDPTTGLQASYRCPDSQSELFIAGTEPADCEEHRDYESWAARMIRWFRRN